MSMQTATPRSNAPLVSVLMPAYNCETYVSEAVSSMLSQTFADFELLVIDDGSTDATRAVLESIHDPRLRLVSNPRNLGLIATLNRGLELASGRYIARMDADDVSAPERLEKQVQFLESHPGVDVLGTMVNLIDEAGRIFGSLADYPTSTDDVRKYMLRECCLVHPTVMFRKDVVQAAGGYDASARHAEDYDLWLRLADRHMIANLPEKLVSYRMHRNQVSINNIVTQHRVARDCRVAALTRRSAMGERIAEVERVVRPGRWRRLTAAECTLGRDYLNWARLYRAMRLPSMALGLAARAVLNSPLSHAAWTSLLTCLTEAALPRSWQRATKWYAHRVAKALHPRGHTS